MHHKMSSNPMVEAVEAVTGETDVEVEDIYYVFTELLI